MVDNNNKTKWVDIASSDEYKGLLETEKRNAKEVFFERNVAPNWPGEEDDARDAFFTQASQYDLNNTPTYSIEPTGIKQSGRPDILKHDTISMDVDDSDDEEPRKLYGYESEYEKISEDDWPGRQAFIYANDPEMKRRYSSAPSGGIVDVKPEYSIRRSKGIVVEGTKDVAKSGIGAGIALTTTPEQADPTLIDPEVRERLAKHPRGKAFMEREKTSEYLVNLTKADWLKANPEYVKSAGFFEDVLRMTPQLFGQFAITAATGGVGGIAYMGTQILGSTYLSLREQGVPHDRAKAASFANAIIQAPLEYLGLNKLSKFIPARSSIMKKLKGYGVKYGTEWLTEFLQSYPDAAATIWARNPDKTSLQQLGIFADKFGETSKQGAYEGLVALGGMAPMAGISNTMGTIRREAQANRVSDKLNKQGLKLTPDTIQRLMESGGPAGAMKTIAPRGIKGTLPAEKDDFDYGGYNDVINKLISGEIENTPDIVDLDYVDGTQPIVDAAGNKEFNSYVDAETTRNKAFPNEADMDVPNHTIVRNENGAFVVVDADNLKTQDKYVIERKGNVVSDRTATPKLNIMEETLNDPNWEYAWVYDGLREYGWANRITAMERPGNEHLFSSPTYIAITGITGGLTDVEGAGVKETAIGLNMDLIEHSSDRTNEIALAHEGIHARFRHALGTVGSELVNNFHTDLGGVINNISTDQYNQFLKHLHSLKNTDPERPYFVYLKNTIDTVKNGQTHKAEELPAIALSSPKVRDFLQSVRDTEGNQTLWTKIKQFIGRVALGKDYTKSKFDQLLDVLDKHHALQVGPKNSFYQSPQQRRGLGDKEALARQPKIVQPETQEERDAIVDELIDSLPSDISSEKLTSTGDADRLGSRLVGNKAAIDQLKARREQVLQQFNKETDPQKKMDIATQSQFIREAIEVAEGTMKPLEGRSEVPITSTYAQKELDKRDVEWEDKDHVVRQDLMDSFNKDGRNIHVRETEEYLILDGIYAPADQKMATAKVFRALMKESITLNKPIRGFIVNDKLLKGLSKRDKSELTIRTNEKGHTIVSFIDTTARALNKKTDEIKALSEEPVKPNGGSITDINPMDTQPFGPTYNSDKVTPLRDPKGNEAFSTYEEAEFVLNRLYPDHAKLDIRPHVITNNKFGDFVIIKRGELSRIISVIERHGDDANDRRSTPILNHLERRINDPNWNYNWIYQGMNQGKFFTFIQATTPARNRRLLRNDTELGSTGTVAEFSAQKGGGVHVVNIALNAPMLETLYKGEAETLLAHEGLHALFKHNLGSGSLVDRFNKELLEAYNDLSKKQLKELKEHADSLKGPAHNQFVSLIEAMNDANNGELNRAEELPAIMISSPEVNQYFKNLNTTDGRSIWQRFKDLFARVVLGEDRSKTRYQQVMKVVEDFQALNFKAKNKKLQSPQQIVEYGRVDIGMHHRIRGSIGTGMINDRNLATRPLKDDSSYKELERLKKAGDGLIKRFAVRRWDNINNAIMGVQKRLWDKYAHIKKDFPEAYTQIDSFQIHREEIGLALVKLDKIMEPGRNHKELVERYLIASHNAVEEARALKEKGQAYGQPLKDAYAEVRKIEEEWVSDTKKDKGTLRELAIDYSDWNKEYILGPLVDSDIISKTKRNSILHENPFYISDELINKIYEATLKRDKMAGWFSTQKGSVLHSVSQTVNPDVEMSVNSAIEKMTKTLSIARRNKATLSFVNEAKGHLKNGTLDLTLRPIVETKEEIAGASTFMQEAGLLEDVDHRYEGIIHLYAERGKPVMYAVDKVYADVLKNYDRTFKVPVLTTSKQITSRTATSFNPGFWGQNVILDAPTNFFTSEAWESRWKGPLAMVGKPLLIPEFLYRGLKNMGKLTMYNLGYSSSAPATSKALLSRIPWFKTYIKRIAEGNMSHEMFVEDGVGGEIITKKRRGLYKFPINEMIEMGALTGQAGYDDPTGTPAIAKDPLRDTLLGSPLKVSASVLKDLLSIIRHPIKSRPVDRILNSEPARYLESAGRVFEGMFRMGATERQILLEEKEMLKEYDKYIKVKAELMVEASKDAESIINKTLGNIENSIDILNDLGEGLDTEKEIGTVKDREKRISIHTTILKEQNGLLKDMDSGLEMKEVDGRIELGPNKKGMKKFYDEIGRVGRESSINWGKMGSWIEYQASVVPFANVLWRVSEKALYGFADPRALNVKTAEGRKHLKRVSSNWAALVSISFAAEIAHLAMLLSGDEEEVEERMKRYYMIPLYDRLRTFSVPFDGPDGLVYNDQGKVISVKRGQFPKPGIGRICNIWEKKILDAAGYGDPNQIEDMTYIAQDWAIETIGADRLGIVVPGEASAATRVLGAQLPPSVKTTIQLALNKNLYKDRPIETDRMKLKPFNERYTKYTPEFYKGASEFLDEASLGAIQVSPVKLHLAFKDQFTAYADGSPMNPYEAFGVIRRFYKDYGSERQRKVIKFIKPMDEKYQRAKDLVISEIEAGNYQEANEMVKMWNKAGVDRLSQRAIKLGFKDYGKLRKKYTITKRKIDQTLAYRKKRGDKDWIEQQYGIE